MLINLLQKNFDKSLKVSFSSEMNLQSFFFFTFILHCCNDELNPRASKSCEKNFFYNENILQTFSSSWQLVKLIVDGVRFHFKEEFASQFISKCKLHKFHLLFSSRLLWFKFILPADISIFFMSSGNLTIQVLSFFSPFIVDTFNMHIL